MDRNIPDICVESRDTCLARKRNECHAKPVVRVCRTEGRHKFPRRCPLRHGPVEVTVQVRLVRLVKKSS